MDILHIYLFRLVMPGLVALWILILATASKNYILPSQRLPQHKTAHQYHRLLPFKVQPAEENIQVCKKFQGIMNASSLCRYKVSLQVQIQCTSTGVLPWHFGGFNYRRKGEAVNGFTIQLSGLNHGTDENCKMTKWLTSGTNANLETDECFWNVAIANVFRHTM